MVLEGAAVEVVAAAAGDHVDVGAGVAPVLRGEVRGLDRDFLDEVDADVADLAVVAAGVHVEAAVHREQAGIGAAAVDRGVDPEAGHDVEGVEVVVEERRSRDEARELQVLATIQGQVLDLLAVHNPGDLSRDGVDGLAGHRDLDDLVDVAHPEGEVGGHPAVGHERKAGLDGFLESAQLRAHGIAPDGQADQDVAPSLVCEGGAREARAFLGDGHGHAGQDSALGVGHGPRDPAGRALGRHVCRREHQEHDGGGESTAEALRPIHVSLLKLERALSREGWAPVS